MISDDEFLEELRREFLIEAACLLEQWEESFLKIESSEHKSQELTNIFRVAHSIKGTSSAVGYTNMAEFAHIVEDLLSMINKFPDSLTPEMISLLLKCGDAFKTKVVFLMGQGEKDWDVQELTQEIQVALCSFASAKKVQVTPVIEKTENIEKPIEDDEAWKTLLAQVNNELGVNITEEDLKLTDDEIMEKVALQRSAPLNQLKPTIEMVPETHHHEEVLDEKKSSPISTSVPPKTNTVKVDADKIDKIMNLIGELVINTSQLANRVGEHKDDVLLEATYSLLEKTIRELQDETLSIRMIGLKNLFLKCQRAVRDVSLKLGKSIEFIQIGEDVEIDRSMVELLTDPLLHMLRNAADHGIESDAERSMAGKKSGTIQLKAEHIGTKIIISIKDDGKGINPEKVFNKAKQNGLISSSVNINDLTENEIFQFIMMPGFSTAEKITDVSGRGVGLDVVKTSIQKMNGKIEIESSPGKGTLFKLVLPLTTSIQEGIHIKSSGSSYIFPTEKVYEILSGDQLDLIHDPNGMSMFKYRDMVIPYSTLDLILGKSRDSRQTKMVLILESEGKHFGVGIDEFVAQVHVVLKPINEIVRTSTAISASCILSHGGIGFVLDTDIISKLVVKSSKNSNRLVAA